jgi:histidyl-tRNA synthetase
MATVVAEIDCPVMHALPGFREFYPEDCARRNYITGVWRETARRHGFAEYDGPALEPVELYLKKSGGELSGQLFDFTDKGERHVTLRPEMTPTLARMIAARERDYRKPLKWFSVANFFRYEKQQRGRLREFLQFNCDIVGDASPAADAELIGLVAGIFRAFGFGSGDFVVRLSDRNAWIHFLREAAWPDAPEQEFLAIIDKLERDSAETTEAKLRAFGLTLESVRAFIARGRDAAPGLAAVCTELDARGLSGFYEVDLTVVRGLAYYTGTVFEVFDRGRKLRALAGGGRYDGLVKLLSDGKVDLPAVGAGLGDVTLGELIAIHPLAAAALQAAVARAGAAEVYVVIADESRRPEALSLAADLREAGHRVDYALGPAKVGRQFQSAEAAGARVAVVVGAEWPEVKLKVLASREECAVAAGDSLAGRVRGILGA